MKRAEGEVPLYGRLRDAISRRIAAGEWRPGEAIPTENSLAASHEVAVGTVRKALDLLAAEGVLERRQGRGTFLRRPSFERSLFRFFRHHGPGGPDTVPEGRILRRALAVPPPEACRALGLPAGAEAILVARLRLVDGRPLLAERIWLPLPRFEPLLRARTEEIGDLLYPAYERLCGTLVARATESLTIGLASADEAALLAVAPGSPLIAIERTAFGFDDAVLEWRRSVGAAADFRYQVEIR